MIIRISGLNTMALLGIYDQEKVNRQPVEIDLEIVCPFPENVETSGIDDVPDYSEIEKKVQRLVEVEHVGLIELLGYRVLQIVMEDERISQTVIRIRKPEALIVSRFVELELTAQRVGNSFTVA